MCLPQDTEQASGRSAIPTRVCPTPSPAAILRSCLAELPSARGGSAAIPNCLPHPSSAQRGYLSFAAHQRSPMWLNMLDNNRINQIAARFADVRAISVSGVSKGRFRFDKLIKNAKASAFKSNKENRMQSYRTLKRGGGGRFQGVSLSLSHTNTHTPHQEGGGW